MPREVSGSTYCIYILKALKLTGGIQAYENDSGVLGLTVHETVCEHGCVWLD
jgi:hypothetical protein